MQTENYFARGKTTVSLEFLVYDDKKTTTKKKKNEKKIREEDEMNSYFRNNLFCMLCSFSYPFDDESHQIR